MLQRFVRGVLILASLAAAPVSLGQQYRGSLTGLVVDQQQAIVPNVKITAVRNVLRTRRAIHASVSVSRPLPG